jgi:polyisoprenoid-binding protein YceI
MKQKIVKLVSLFILIASSSSSVFSKQFEVNDQHSFVNFEVDYMKVSVVKGSFDDFQGSFQLDEKTNKVTNLDFTISTKSINSRDYKRDKHLRQSDFFYSKKFPTIYFTGTKMKYVDGVLSEVTGSLELVGVIKPVSFAIDWKGFMNDPIDKGKKSLFLRAKTTLNRQDFGLNWNKSLDSGGWIVSDNVRVDIIIEATPSDSRPAFSRFLKRNKKLKKNPFENLKKGDLKEPSPTVDSLIPVKKKPIIKEISANESRGFKSYALLFFGFFVFLGLLIGGGFLKKGLMSFLEKHMSERASELISDFVLYSVLLAAAIVSAPYMGYGDYFAK